MPNEALKHGQRMAEDWDDRANDSPMYWIAMTEDRNAFIESGERDVEQYLLNDIAIDSAALVLEIGCGIGRLLHEFASRCRLALGVDVSSKMIELSKQYLADRPNAQAFANAGSDLAIVEDGTIDFCYSYICFQHIPERKIIEDYIREAFRVLRPGGIFKFQVDGAVWDGRLKDHAETWLGVCYTPTEIREVCLETGFSVLYIKGGNTQYLW